MAALQRIFKSHTEKCKNRRIRNGGLVLLILLQVDEKNAQQRFDKYLRRILPNAPTSLIYKQLRKKNIVLNGKKADGSEKLQAGDEVRLFFADETYQKFTAVQDEQDKDSICGQYIDAYVKLKDRVSIVFENEHILAADKQAGVLSQKAKPDDISVNEWLIGYLMENGSISTQTLAAFKPSICNRLDRNTSGMIICGKTLAGSQYISSIIKNKTLEKYYYCLVNGKAMLNERITGWLYKDNASNTVRIYGDIDEIPEEIRAEADFIDTSFMSVRFGSNATLVEARLFTGKTHQIRAQLAAMGYPIIGDTKYGDVKINHQYRALGIKSQLLHSHKLVFPPTDDKRFVDISGLTLETKPPAIFEKVMSY